LGHILHVLVAKNFLGELPPEILDRDYKIEHTSITVQKFHGDQSTELGDLAREKKKKNTAKYKSATKAIASGRTNNATALAYFVV